MKVVTSLRLDKENKEFAKKFFKKFNLTLSDGINLFLAKIAMDKKLPFELKLPSEETEKAIKEVENGEVYKYDSVDELMKDLRS